MIRRLSHIFIAMAAMLLLLPGGRAEAARPEGVDMTFEVGYDGIVQKGRINPVAVDIDNHSSGINLSGELVLKYEGTEYTTHLELPSPSRKRVYLYFPCTTGYPAVSLMIRTEQWTDEMDLGQYFKTCEAGDTSIVVLTDQDGSLQAANQVESTRITRDEFVRASAGLDSSKSYVSYFDIDEVDDNAKFFARADSIILADIDYLQLDENIARALMENVARGANLIFCMGSNASKVASSPVGQLCPLQYTGTVETADLGDLGRRYGIDTAGSLATLATGQLRDGAEVLVQAGQYPGIVRSAWGAGNVYALAFNITDRPFRQNQGLAEMFSDLTMNVEHNVDVNNWFIHPQDVFTKMRNLNVAKPMEPGFVALFIGLYVVLIGPLNFFVLGRLKRSTLVWLTIPVIIGSFAWFGLETGRLTRGSDNIVAGMQELHMYPRASFMPYQDSMYIFTAEPVRYELSVDDPSSFLYTDYPTHAGEGIGGQLAQNRGGINPFITNSLDDTINPQLSVSQGKWAAKEYYFRGYRNLQAGFTPHLKDVQGSATTSFNPQGSFDLELPWDLLGCRLVGRDNYVRDIGDLAGKGSYDMASLVNASSQAWFSSDNYISQYREELLRNSQNAQSFGLNYSNDMLLIGFTDKLEPLAEFPRTHIQHSLAMVVLHMPCPRQLPAGGALQAMSDYALLTGGRNFGLSDKSVYNYGYGYNYDQEYAEDPNKTIYEVAKGGYIECRIDLIGKLSERNYAELVSHVLADARDPGNEITDLQGIIAVEGLADNGRWINLGISAGTRAARLDLKSLIQPDNTIHVRIRAVQDDIQCLVPEVSIR